MPGELPGFRASSVRADEPAARWKANLDPSKKEDRMLKKAYERTIAQIRENFLHGEVVPVPKDPRFDDLTNLRCEDLAGFRRMLYTVIRTQEGVHVLVVDIVTHKEYDRLFGIRKR